MAGPHSTEPNSSEQGVNSNQSDSSKMVKTYSAVSPSISVFPSLPSLPYPSYPSSSHSSLSSWYTTLLPGVHNLPLMLLTLPLPPVSSALHKIDELIASSIPVSSSGSSTSYFDENNFSTNDEEWINVQQDVKQPQKPPRPAKSALAPSVSFPSGRSSSCHSSPSPPKPMRYSEKYSLWATTISEW